MAWVEDSTVDGTVIWDRASGRISADVSVSGSGVVGGSLHLAWSDWDQLSVGSATGTVGGEPVKLESLAP